MQMQMILSEKINGLIFSALIYTFVLHHLKKTKTLFWIEINEIEKFILQI